jgi:hypothetical protein
VDLSFTHLSNDISTYLSPQTMDVGGASFGPQHWNLHGTTRHGYGAGGMPLTNDHHSGDGFTFDLVTQ